MAKQFKTRFSLALFTSLPMNLLRYCYTQLNSEIVCEQFTIQKALKIISSSIQEKEQFEYLARPQIA